jgi:toxin ParE1/3/4
MTPLPIEFHPRAIVEARGVRRRYAHKSVALANRFMAALDDALARIANAPHSWPPYLHGTRVYRLRRFSYLVVYLELPGSLQVLALAHDKRRPGYWRRRLP